jgi:ferrochelatase
MNRHRYGIALLNMGSPASPGTMRDFLYRLFSDPEIFRFPGGRAFRPLFAGLISTMRAPRVRRRYRAIGGISPLLDITRKQAAALENALLERDAPMPVEICMRYSHPLSGEAVQNLLRRGAEEIVGVPLYPQFSMSTTGSSLQALREAVNQISPDVKLREIEHWYGEPAYQGALARRILARLGKSTGTGKTGVLFLAHSIPERFRREGDPYIDQVEATVSGVVEILEVACPDRVPWFLAYQSQVGPVEWVGPTVPEALKTMMAEEVLETLVVPVSFVSDHLETLYEIDFEHRREAFEIGMKRFERIDPLNDSDDFIQGLAAMILRRLDANGNGTAPAGRFP